MSKQQSGIITWRVILALSFLTVAAYLLFGRESRLHRTFPAEVVMQGPWNDYAAGRYVSGRLEEYGDAADYGFDTHGESNRGVRHFIYDYYHMMHLGGERHLVAAYSKPQGFECPSCAPKLTLVEFRNREDGWFTGAISIGKIEAGAWGSPPDRIAVSRIGTDWFGVIIEYNRVRDDVEETVISIYTVIDNEFREVFSLVTGMEGSPTDDKGTPVGPWRIEILQKKLTEPGFYDILARRRYKQEIDDTTELYQSVLYTFNGDRYVALNQ